MHCPTQIGNWQKISDLGSGAFGVVTLWKESTTNECIAIKKCRFQTNQNLTKKHKDRWNNEVDIMKSIDHPNIIKYRHIPAELENVLLKHNPTKLPLLPMEYCKNGNLRRVLCKPRNLAGLEDQDVRHILEDISNGLRHLHSLNITHRDIKPDNIVLQHCDNRKGNTIYKIIDLGYAKELGDSVLSFVGTLHYLAPEIFETETYNKSVDYWSMGILTFEIICGVLPFPPLMTPFERFEKLREKGPDDICIYQSYSGQIAHSSEIRKEHLISSCLKQNIEIWLRHVLQFDQTKRSQNFPCNVGVFDYLTNILQKRIVTVFYAYKLEFYSYEINEGTLISTLRGWVSRDVNAPKDDLVLLLQNGTLCTDDSGGMLSEILKVESHIYVLRKSAIINNQITYNLPKLIREALKSAKKFNVKYIKQLYSQLVYYVNSEKLTARCFRDSFHLYFDYLSHLIENLTNKTVITSQILAKLLQRLKCYISIRKNNVCDIDVFENTEYKDCLNYSQRLFASMERTLNRFNDLESNIKVIKRRQRILASYLPDVVKILDGYNLEKEYEKAIVLHTENDKSKPFISSITSLMSETIRVKDKLFRNDKFKAYLGAIENVVSSTDKLLSWIEQFNVHIQELASSFEHSEMMYRNSLSKAAENAQTESMVSSNGIDVELLKLPYIYLIKENQTLRYRFEDLLSKSILDHKNYAQY